MTDEGPATGTDGDRHLDASADGSRFPAEAERRAPSDTAALRATREEARTILDHEIRLLNDLDDKAMRTVRTAVVTLGALISAAGLGGPSAVASVGAWPLRLFALGCVCLLVTILVGTVASTDSDVILGPNEAFRSEAKVGGYSETEWLVTLLDGYDAWIAYADEVASRNELRLFVAQVALFGAFLAFGAAVGLFIMMQ